MNIFKALHAYTVVRDAVNAGTSAADVLSRIDAATIDDLEAIGGDEFPKAKPELHALAVVLETYDPDHGKWLQKFLNRFLDPSPHLDEKGAYGPVTQRAVGQLLRQFGIIPDSPLGDVTSAGLQMLVAKGKTVAIAA